MTQTMTMGKPTVGSNLYSPAQSHVVKNNPNWIMRLIVSTLLFLTGLFALDYLFSPSKYEIKRVITQGELKNVNAQMITQQIQKSIRGNYFSLDLKELKNRLKQIPWVFSVSLRRRWPDTLVVNIAEIEPIAKWGETQWIHITGDIVPAQSIENELLLPQLIGPDRNRAMVWKNFKLWQGWFATSGFLLNSLQLDLRGNWILSLSMTDLAKTYFMSSNNADDLTLHIIVNDQNKDRKLKKFIHALALEPFDDIYRVAFADLRYPNGFAVQFRAEAITTQTVLD